ncbi:MAG TPA: NlpC/P60 family protein [Actinospica sp.]|nr:NlpC/P60 family protein [Actinospica sp.]
MGTRRGIRRSRVLLPLGCAALTAAILTGLVGGAQADPVYPSQNQVDQANQAANDAKAAVTPAQSALEAGQQHLAQLETAARAAQQRYTEATAREQAALQEAAQATRKAHDAVLFADAAKVELGRLVAAAYRGGEAADLSSLTIVLDVKDPQQYMDGVHVVRRMLSTQSSIVNQAEDASTAAAAAKTQADASAAALKTAQAEVEQSATAAQQAADAAQTQVDALGSQLDALLAKRQAAQSEAAQLAQQRQNGLAQQQAEQEAAQRAAQQDSNGGGSDSGSGSGDGGSGPSQSTGVGVPRYASGIAAQALQFALAQLGKPYKWGGTGPDSFDCSGLAMRAYESAGIDLPHFAAFQYQASHSLTYGQLQPGDLLFWATDAHDSNTIYHEAMYLGSGKMVQAPKTGWNVMISDMWMWGPIQFYARPY